MPLTAVYSDACKTNILVSIFIVFATFLAYWHILHNGFVGYDDVTYLMENDHVRAGLSVGGVIWAFSSSYDANWIPLTWLSHMADMSMFGPDPLGHHLVNLLLHIANVLLLHRLLTGMTGAVWRSAAVALLFALHPLHVESVAWAAERKDVLSTLFFMLTITAYLRYVAKRTVLRYLSVVVLYACGLLAKPMVVSLPFVLLLLDTWPLRRLAFAKTGQNNAVWMGTPALWLEKLPLVILAAVSCVVTFIVQRTGGAVNDTVNSPFSENAAHAACNYVTYLCKTLLAIWQWDRKPYLAVGWFWYLITMVPVIGLVRIGIHSIADRYTYIPLIGIFIMAVWELAHFLELKRHGKVIAALLTIVLFPTLGAATYKQAGYWHDSISLFEHTLNVTMDNWVIHNNLAAEMIKYGMNRKALWHVNEAIRIKPDYATAYQNLGALLSSLNDEAGAIRAYRSALEHNPKFTEAYYQLSLTYFQAGDHTAAFETCEALARLDPALALSLKKYLILIGNPRGM